jgi:hypothetical protein
VIVKQQSQIAMTQTLLHIVIQQLKIINVKIKKPNANGVKGIWGQHILYGKNVDGHRMLVAVFLQS